MPGGQEGVATVRSLLGEGHAKAALVAENVSLTFGGVRALDSVTLRIEPGIVHALIGPNGSGKTTLVNVLSGFLRPSAGSVSIGEVAIDGLRTDERARAGIIRTFQFARVVPELSALENLMLGVTPWATTNMAAEVLYTPSAIASDRKAQGDARVLLDLLGLGSVARSRSGELSYGMQRRIELGRAVMSRPKFLLLDEPGAGIAGPELSIVEAVIGYAAEAGIACLVIDHNVAFIERIASHLTVLAAGRVIAEGHTREVLGNKAVQVAYLGSEAAPR